MPKRGLIFITLLALFVSFTASAQRVGLKTNALYLATTTPNIGLDVKFNEHWSGSLTLGYNPWKLPNNNEITLASGGRVSTNPKLMHFLAMPEIKW